MMEYLIEALAFFVSGLAWFGSAELVERLAKKREEEPAVTHEDLESLKDATAEAFGVYDKKIKRLQKRVRELEKAAKGEA